MTLKVLIIDDSKTIRSITENHLREEEYEVISAEDVTSGIKQILDSKPDLILLDFLLTDGQRGTDVVEGIKNNEIASKIPVILLSGKDASIKDKFTSYPQVRGFIGKPYTKNELILQVGQIIGSSKKTAENQGEAKAEVWSFAQKNIVAQAVFVALKDKFKGIPDWYRELGDSQPGSFFAKRILTPEAITNIMLAVTPVFRQLLGNSAHEKMSIIPVSTISIIDYLTVIQNSRKTGRMDCYIGAEMIMSIWCQSGKISVVIPGKVTSVNWGIDIPVNWQDTPEHHPLETISGGNDIAYKIGRSLVLKAIETGDSWSWIDGRFPENLQPLAKPFPVLQVLLDRLKLVADINHIEQIVGSQSSVPRRSNGFSSMVTGLDLNRDERAVLSYIDGKMSVSELILKTGISTYDVNHILYRFALNGIIICADKQDSSLPSIGVRANDDVSLMISGCFPRHDIRQINELEDFGSQSYHGDLGHLIVDDAVPEWEKFLMASSSKDKVKVIFLGSNEAAIDRAKSLHTTCLYLMKPVIFDDLRHHINIMP